jgi:pSer/pThr/pTyr-binding forkhead associated (FHA) protein
MVRVVDLVVVEGPDRGERFAVEENSYRVLVRGQDDFGASTQQMTAEGDHIFDDAQQSLIDELSGRSRTAFKKRGHDIALRDGSVSRTHALVFVDRESVSVADLMSTNGTRVNGAGITDCNLREGDVIHVGKSRLRVECRSSS